MVSAVTPSQELPDLTAELKTKDWDRSARHSEINESQLCCLLSAQYLKEDDTDCFFLFSFARTAH